MAPLEIRGWIAPSLAPSAVLPGRLLEESICPLSKFQFVKKVPSLFAIWLSKSERGGADVR